MFDLIWALFFFVLFVLSHVASYRFGMIKFQTAPLFSLCLFWLFLYYVTLQFLEVFYPAEVASNLFSTRLIISSGLLYLFLSLWYFGQIIVVHYESPSMKILDAINKRKNLTIAPHELEGLFSNEELIHVRLDDLVLHGHIKLERGRYYIQSKGALILKAIKFYRSLLGRTIGG